MFEPIITGPATLPVLLKYFLLDVLTTISCFSWSTDTLYTSAGYGRLRIRHWKCSGLIAKQFAWRWQSPRGWNSHSRMKGCLTVTCDSLVARSAKRLISALSIWEPGVSFRIKIGLLLKRDWQSIACRISRNNSGSRHMHTGPIQTTEPDPVENLLPSTCYPKTKGFGFCKPLRQQNKWLCRDETTEPASLLQASMKHARCLSRGRRPSPSPCGGLQAPSKKKLFHDLKRIHDTWLVKTGLSLRSTKRNKKHGQTWQLRQNSNTYLQTSENISKPPMASDGHWDSDSRK